MSRLVDHIPRLLLTVTLSIALAASALAHRAPITGENLALAAFVSVGGDLSDLCGGDGEHPFHGRNQSCDACRLVGAALVPRPPIIAPRAQAAPRRIRLYPAAACLKPTTRDFAHSARAPPAD